MGHGGMSSMFCAFGAKPDGCSSRVVIMSTTLFHQFLSILLIWLSCWLPFSITFFPLGQPTCHVKFKILTGIWPHSIGQKVLRYTRGEWELLPASPGLKGIRLTAMAVIEFWMASILLLDRCFLFLMSASWWDTKARQLLDLKESWDYVIFISESCAERNFKFVPLPSTTLMPEVLF